MALLQRRARLVAVGGSLAALAVLVFLAVSVQQDSTVNTFDGGGQTVDISLPTDRPRPKPTTLTVSPGRTSVLDTPIQPEARPQNRGTVEPVSPDGLNWMALLTNVAPLFGGVAYLWRAGRKRALAGLDEVNLGVYKGPLPLELHTAQHRDFVFTRRFARASLFGKRREDFLPSAPVVMFRGRSGARGGGR